MCTVEPKVTLISLSVDLQASRDAGTLLRPSAKPLDVRQRNIASFQVALLDFVLFLFSCFSTTLRRRYASSCSRTRLEHLNTWHCLFSIAFSEDQRPWNLPRPASLSTEDFGFHLRLSVKLPSLSP